MREQQSSVSQTTVGTVMTPTPLVRAMPQPAALSLTDFAHYPLGARAQAEQRLSLLRSLPLPFLPILLREISTFDWKFPIERSRLAAQLEWLAALSPAQRSALVSPFAELRVRVAPILDWVNDPSAYLEQLTAELWSSNSMPAFRSASERYAEALRNAVPDPVPARARLCIAVLDAELRSGAGQFASFSALRPHGVALTGIDPQGGFGHLLERLKSRAAVASKSPSYAHWYVDGGPAADTMGTSNTAITSYSTLDPMRRKLLQRAQQVMTKERSGPEELRSLMSHYTPADLGLPSNTDPVLTRFQLSLLTEGSGTQVFATSFVQWAAREILRRAEPESLLLRFRPRQRQQGMNELLSGAASLGPDLPGSLIDAEQGAYYTWLNLMRLPGAEQALFVAWQEGRSDAVVIGPGLARGTTSPTNSNLNNALDRLI